jgi:SAM-dependent methyltransferase
MTAEASQSLQSSRGDIHFAVLDVTSLPFPAHSIDVIIANHMLYHVPNRPRALSALRRVLRPGGRLFAATNGQRHLAEIYSWVARAADLSAPEITYLWDSVTLSFNLENGADQLRGYFDYVEMRRYPDSLAVTEVAPLLDYAGTMMGDMPAILHDNSVRERLTALWRQELERSGVIHISKDSGLFIAA